MGLRIFKRLRELEAEVDRHDRAIEKLAQALAFSNDQIPDVAAVAAVRAVALSEIDKNMRYRESKTKKKHRVDV